MNAESFLRKALGVILGAVLLAAALLFSVVVFAVLAVGGLLVLGYLWWKTRDLRRQLRQQVREPAPGGRVIEGEVVHETVVIEHIDDVRVARDPEQGPKN